MHYIIGHKITVGGVVQSEAPRLRSIGAQQVKRSVPTDGFEAGKTYSIFYIRRTDNGVQYTFTEDGGDGKIEKQFANTKEGDVYIAKLLGDKLPDYDKFYNESNH